jgi:anti-anti-sigma regulatory factor
MYLAEFDPLQRLVKITVAGDATAEEVISARESLRAVLKDVQPGFRLLADLSAVVSMPTSVAPHLGEIMELCAEKGVALVVRLLPPEPSKDIGLAIISQFHYPPDVPIVTCATMEEAIRLLEEKTERN